MNYKDFTLGDGIGHISGVIEDETTLDDNEIRDLVEFLTTLKQKPIDKVKAEVEEQEKWLMSAGYNAYNVRIAFDAIKLAVEKARD